jgi:hypothetical protein
MVHSFRATVAESRRHGNLYFAALLSQDRIEKAFDTARWLWQGWKKGDRHLTATVFRGVYTVGSEPVPLFQQATSRPAKTLWVKLRPGPTQVVVKVSGPRLANWISKKSR